MSVIRYFVRAARHALLVAAGALMLLWVGLVDGRPAVFSDTALYYSQAEYLADAIGLVSPHDDRVPAGDPTALPARPGQANVSVAIDGGRSPIYGLFVYALERLGGLWLVAAAQAALAAGALYLLFRLAAPAVSPLWYLLWMAALAAFTSAPAFSSFIMPDVLGGVAGVIGVSVLVYWDRLKASGRSVAVAVLVFSLSAHRANLLALAGTAASGVLWLGLTELGWRRAAGRAGILFAAAAASWVLVAAAFLPINQRAGETVRDPPFLMARLLADGPGRRYLQYACTHHRPLALCRFSRLPAEDSDTLLWSHRKGVGLFGVSDFATQMQLEAQEHGFVLSTLAYAPMDVLRDAGLNTWRQLKLNHVQSPFADPARFVRDGYWRRTSLVRIIPGAQTCRRWGDCAPRLSQPAWARIHDTALSLSLILIGGLVVILGLGRRQTGLAPAAADEAWRLVGLLLLSVAFVLFNAFVCGALSAPVARYQARLIWMIPAVALLAALVMGARYASSGAATRKSWPNSRR